MAQFGGYTLARCWPHIGSAQSVVAYAFIQRDIDECYTPIQWIKEMTPIILRVLVVITVLIYIESALLEWLHLAIAKSRAEPTRSGQSWPRFLPGEKSPSLVR
jgi:hypothetical protein